MLLLIIHDIPLDTAVISATYSWSQISYLEAMGIVTLIKILNSLVLSKCLILWSFPGELNAKRGYYIYKAVSNTHVYISFKRENHTGHKTYGILSSSVIH